MRHPLRRLLLRAFLAIVPIDTAFAACTGNFQAQPDFAPGFTFFGTYDPSQSAPTVVSTTFTIVPAQGMSPPCSMYVVVSTPTGMKDAGWTRTLAYSFGGDFAKAVGFGSSSGFLVNLQNGQNQTFTTSVIIPPKQNHPPQTLTEHLDVRFYSHQGQLLRNFTLQVTAVVKGSCILPSPSVAHLNFSGGIVNGQVTPHYTLSTVINGASCSGAAKLILRGAPLRTGLNPTAHFDNVIHYRATAKMGSAASVLDTNSASESMVPLSPATGPLAVDVSLIAKGKPPAAGTYSSVLSIVLEPSN